MNITHSFELNVWYRCPFGYWLFEKFCKLENKVDCLRRYIGFAPESVLAKYS